MTWQTNSFKVIQSLTKSSFHNGFSTFLRTSWPLFDWTLGGVTKECCGNLFLNVMYSKQDYLDNVGRMPNPFRRQDKVVPFLVVFCHGLWLFWAKSFGPLSLLDFVLVSPCHDTINLILANNNSMPFKYNIINQKVCLKVETQLRANSHIEQRLIYKKWMLTHSSYWSKSWNQLQGFYTKK